MQFACAPFPSPKAPTKAACRAAQRRPAPVFGSMATTYGGLRADSFESYLLSDHLPEMQQLGAFLRDQGMYAFINWNNLFTNPPLCITEEQLRDAFGVIDRALEITDAAVTG